MPGSRHRGSTEHIVKTIKEAPAGTRWLVGTELNLVDRLAKEVLPQDKIVQFMATTICMCSTMQRIDPQHLAWTLENLADGNVVNAIRVPEHEARLAKLALDRMLAVSLTMPRPFRLSSRQPVAALAGRRAIGPQA